MHQYERIYSYYTGSAGDTGLEGLQGPRGAKGSSGLTIPGILLVHIKKTSCTSSTKNFSLNKCDIDLFEYNLEKTHILIASRIKHFRSALKIFTGRALTNYFNFTRLKYT